MKNKQSLAIVAAYLCLLFSSHLFGSQTNGLKVTSVQTKNDQYLPINRVLYQTLPINEGISRNTQQATFRYQAKSQTFKNKLTTGTDNIFIDHEIEDISPYTYLDLHIFASEALPIHVGVRTTHGKTIFMKKNHMMREGSQWLSIPLVHIKNLLPHSMSLLDIESFAIKIIPPFANINSMPIVIRNVQLVPFLMTRTYKHAEKFAQHKTNDALKSSHGESALTSAERLPTSSLISNGLAYDTSSPNISGVSCNGHPVVNGSFLPAKGEITIDFVATSSGIATWNLQIMQENNLIQSFSGHGNGETEATAFATYTNKLDNGTYSLKLTVKDIHGNTTTDTRTPIYIQSELAVSQLICGPNPVNLNKSPLSIEYQLSENAAVTCYIYSISGEKQWETTIDAGIESGGCAGFNTIQWDGFNHWGEPINTGPYIVYLIAKSQDESIVKKEKVMVIR